MCCGLYATVSAGETLLSQGCGLKVQNSKVTMAFPMQRQPLGAVAPVSSPKDATAPVSEGKAHGANSPSRFYSLQTRNEAHSTTYSKQIDFIHAFGFMYLAE
jgi:hypothetical protein